MAAGRLQQQRQQHRTRRRTLALLVVAAIVVCAAPSPPSRAPALAAAAAATPTASPSSPPRADVASARAAWAGSGWAGAPPRSSSTSEDSTHGAAHDENADAATALLLLELFDGALLAYLRHAFPRDNLLPLSCKGEDWQGGGMALTLVDALDALLILPGRGHLLPAAVEALRRRGVPRAGEPSYRGRDAKVHVFETTIRVLGGLLSAHVLLQRLGPGELLPPPPRVTAAATAGVSSPPPPAADALMLQLLLEAAAAGGGGGGGGGATAPLKASTTASSPQTPAPDQQQQPPWRYDGFLLRLARDLADRMLPAFRTRSGVPLAWAHLRGARRTAALPDNASTCTACAGTLLLEFGLLSHLTGDESYRRVAGRAADALFARRTRLGLVGSELSVAMELGADGEEDAEEEDEMEREGQQGRGSRGEDEGEDDDGHPQQQQQQPQPPRPAPPPAPHPHHANPGLAASSPWTSALSTIGPGSDSYYEYLLKAFLQSGDRRRLSEFSALYGDVQRLMAVPSSSPLEGPFPAAFVLDVRADDGRLASPWVSSLGAFWPGMQALLGQTDAARALVSNFSSAAAMHGWLPEVFAADLGGGVLGSDPGWRLRPELAESAFLLHAATGDPRLRASVGAPLARALRAVRRRDDDDETSGGGGGHGGDDSDDAPPTVRPCPGALAHVADVRTGALEDASESYALSETLKYLHLLMAPADSGGGGGGGGASTPAGGASGPGRGAGALVDAFVLTTEGHLALAEPRRRRTTAAGSGATAEDDDDRDDDEAEAAELARDGLLPSWSSSSSSGASSSPGIPSSCRTLCADVGPAAARDGRERAAARRVVAELSRALPLVRAREREVARLRRRRCAACVAVARHQRRHPPEPAARRTSRLVFGGPTSVSPVVRPAPVPHRPKPLIVPARGALSAPPFHPPAHHRPPPPAEPLAAAVCLLDARRFALGMRRREPLRCARAATLGALDLGSGGMPPTAVVLQLARVVAPDAAVAAAAEATARGGHSSGGGGGGHEDADADVDALLPPHGLIIGFEGSSDRIAGGNSYSKNSSGDVVWFDASPPHFGPRPPLVTRRDCVDVLRAARPRLAAQPPCPPHAPLTLQGRSASATCPSAQACEAAAAAAAASAAPLLGACAGGLDPSAPAASSSSFRVPRWLPDAELDDPLRPCGNAEVGAGVPLLAAPLVLADPLDACVPRAGEKAPGEAAAAATAADDDAAPRNAPWLRGALAVVERGGGCSFVDKVLAVQAAGAAGAVVLNTPRAAAAAARDEARAQQQGAAAGAAGTCSAAEAQAAAAASAHHHSPPAYQHPSAMADDAWRAGERPRIPSVMLGPGASRALLKLVRERGGGVATLVARHARAGSLAVGQDDGVVVEVVAQEEGEGDYGDGDEEEEEQDGAAAAAAADAESANTNDSGAPLTWLTLDRDRRARVRERVDLIIPPSSREFVSQHVLAPLHQQRQQWEAGVAAALMRGGGGGGAWGRVGAIPDPPLTAEQAFSQLPFDRKVKELLAAGRAQTLREEAGAARGVAVEAAIERQRRRRIRRRVRKKGATTQTKRPPAAAAR